MKHCGPERMVSVTLRGTSGRVLQGRRWQVWGSFCLGLFTLPGKALATPHRETVQLRVWTSLSRSGLGNGLLL